MTGQDAFVTELLGSCQIGRFLRDSSTVPDVHIRLDLLDAHGEFAVTRGTLRPDSPQARAAGSEPAW